MTAPHDIGATMTGFPFALKSVFRNRTNPELSRYQYNPSSWPIFKFGVSQPVDIPVAELTSVVEGEIIPRLFQAHAQAFSTQIEPQESSETRLAREFVQTLLSRNPDTLNGIVETMRAERLSDDGIYAKLLAPAARLLIDLWQDDEVSYTEVTIGLGRLQQLVRGLAGSTPYNGENNAMSRSALFSPCPGEQQTFGFFMIEELFRWSGWRTWIETASTQDELAANVTCHWFDMLCLCVSRSDNFEQLGATIKSLRRASRNKDIFVLVNGRPFIERPESLAAVSADAYASCGAEALQVVDKALRSVAA